MTKIYAFKTHNVFYQEITEAYFSSMHKLNAYFDSKYPEDARGHFWTEEVEVDPVVWTSEDD